MARSALDALLAQLDDAYEGDPEHWLLANLRNVGEREWLRTPDGGERSIHDIVWHVAACKHSYEHHACGDASIRWSDEGFAAPAPEHREIDAMRACYATAIGVSSPPWTRSATTGSSIATAARTGAQCCRRVRSSAS